MLCQGCKKNDATNTYKRINPTNGKPIEEKYCRECFYRILQAEKKEVCENCGCTLKEFKQKRLVGCALCYETFRDEIMRSVIKMQGAEEHVSSEPPETEEMKRKKREHEKRIVEAMNRK